MRRPTGARNSFRFIGDRLTSFLRWERAEYFYGEVEQTPRSTQNRILCA